MSEAEGILWNMERTCRELSLGRSKIYELAAAGEIEAVHVGRALRFHRDDVISFAERVRAQSRTGGDPNRGA